MIAAGAWLPANNKLVAGEFYAIGIDSQGVSAPQLFISSLFPRVFKVILPIKF